MKLKMFVLHNALPALKTLSEAKLPFKVAYKVTKLIKVIDVEVAISSEFLQNLIKTIGKQQANGQIAVMPDDIEAYSTYMTEQARVMGEEVDVQIVKLPAAELESINFSAQDLLALEPFIDFGDENESTTK